MQHSTTAWFQELFLIGILLHTAKNHSTPVFSVCNPATISSLKYCGSANDFCKYSSLNFCNLGLYFFLTNLQAP